MKDIYFCYERTDTKQFYEFTFSDWAQALDFAKLAHGSGETRLLKLALVDGDRPGAD
jgi:hypothetical protein